MQEPPLLRGRDRYERVMEGWSDDAPGEALTHTVRLADPDRQVELSVTALPSPTYVIEAAECACWSAMFRTRGTGVAALAGTACGRLSAGGGLTGATRADRDGVRMIGWRACRAMCAAASRAGAAGGGANARVAGVDTAGCIDLRILLTVQRRGPPPARHAGVGRRCAAAYRPAPAT